MTKFFAFSLRKAALLMLFALTCIGLLTLLSTQDKTGTRQSNPSDADSEKSKAHWRQFKQRIDARNKLIEQCEKDRGNWPRRYGNDRFCENQHPIFVRKPWLPARGQSNE